MSAICGFVGDAPPELLERMLDAMAARGPRSSRHLGPGYALGHRGRSAHRTGLHVAPSGVVVAVAGTLVPASSDPAPRLAEPLEPQLATLDGAFAAARWEDGALTLLRDPFGASALYVAEVRGVTYFASELSALLAIDGVDRALDAAAIHKYLTFSFVPGVDTPLRGVKRLAPGHSWTVGRGAPRPYFVLEEQVAPELEVQAEAVRALRREARRAVGARLAEAERVGLYLSGGLDSSAIAVWLAERGASARAFTLDFGAHDVERAQAAQVAERLGLPLERVPLDGAGLAGLVDDVVEALELPFGDPVTGPQLALGRAARAAGIEVVLNGEGGDQLFGGWTSKPMMAAELYASAGLFDDADASPEEQYLRTYHRFYGHEAQLYAPEFAAQVGGPGQRRAHLAPYLRPDRGGSFLGRVRLADIGLKGSYNILPRAERLARAAGLEVRVPLFDRALATLAFRLPPALKLHGAAEKYVLKLALQDALPSEIVWRRKFGMSVPITDWLLGAAPGLVDGFLGPDAVARRGLFREGYVARLRAGRADPAEPRRRRVGEKLWTLLVLEAWLRRWVDRGR
jgi:asparagine synthase (glutamine-hydrolysing)